ncbi:hypothetical protein DB88DRAFT_546124 [Papiliotrema laurentii]|uniref:Uncharacterized protein n=1 Tax=Papiliotrema laurentii TaxID=5418 RepID=A0AAD9FPP8_PAPLA|nr:hypothetical protein DB88DRAFT_546124 [Papiliotrema laurentii]
MGLLRTPPQRVSRSSKSPNPASSNQEPIDASIAAATVGDETIPSTIGETTTSHLPEGEDVSTTSVNSPTEVFMPRNPGVMRSPPAHPPPTVGTSVYPALPTSLPPPPAPLVPTSNEEVSMDIDEPSIADNSTSIDLSTPSRSLSASHAAKTPKQNTSSTTPARAGPSRIPAAPTTPAPALHTPAVVLAPELDRSPTASDATLQQAREYATPAAFVTPKPSRAPKTPRSTRKTPAEISKVLDKPAEPIADIPISRDVVEDPEDYGRRWRMTNETLQLVVKRIIQKWTLNDLKKSLPLLSARDAQGLEQVYRSSAQALQEGILTKAYNEFDDKNMKQSLQLLDQVVNEAEDFEKSRSTEHARPDAWRPDLTPAALTAAHVLPVYDEAWASLREEYIGLHEDARMRYASILAKQAQLKDLEGSVSDGVIELEQTIKLLDGFPGEDMMAWMEDVAGRNGARNP